MNEARLKQRLGGLLARRFFLRFHVTLILLWTFAVGLLTTGGLLWLGVESMLARYPLAVVAAWLAFLLGVRVWLWYVGIEVRRGDGDGSVDLPGDLSVPRTSRGTPAEVEPGGGSFGGGGASGDLPSALASELQAAPGLDAVASAAPESAGETVGALLEGAAAAEEAAIPLLLLALIAAVVGTVLLGGLYVVLEAPAILVEAAFEALLAGGLIRTTRRLEDADWSSAVVRRTWVPLAVMLALSIAVALLVQHRWPEVRTLAELLR